MLNYNLFLRNMVTQSSGLVAEWLCRGLQILLCRFDSDPGLQNKHPQCRVFFFVYVKKTPVFAGVFEHFYLSRIVALHFFSTDAITSDCNFCKSESDIFSVG